jgi:hypothetical protein
MVEDSDITLDDGSTFVLSAGALPRSLNHKDLAHMYSLYKGANPHQLPNPASAPESCV